MKAAYDVDPFDKVYEYHLAVVEARTGDLSSAMNHFTQSIGQAEAYYNIGYILKEQGRTTEAEKYLLNAIKMKPDLKQAETTLASIHTGRPINSREVQPASFDEQ
jgi:tetratricopeptide (TPR) repeat protein